MDNLKVTRDSLIVRGHPSDVLLGIAFLPDTEADLLGLRFHKITLVGQSDDETQLCDATFGTVWMCTAGIEETNIRLFGDLDRVLHLYISEGTLTKSTSFDFDIGPAQA